MMKLKKISVSKVLRLLNINLVSLKKFLIYLGKVPGWHREGGHSTLQALSKEQTYYQTDYTYY